MACDLENNCVALERIFEYTKLNSEGEWKRNSHNYENKDIQQWPSQGQIEFKNYQTKYREGLPNVLKGLTLKVDSHEKIGICGRTGAGKSSLTLALFRIIEANGGQIVIDGIDVSQLGLHELRAKLSIIPQVEKKIFFLLLLLVQGLFSQCYQLNVMCIKAGFS